MSAILNPPSTVVFAGPEETVPSDQLLGGETDEVRVVEDVAALETALVERSSVACLVLDSSYTTSASREFVDAVRAVDGDLPVVFLVDDADVDRLRLALDADPAELVSHSPEDQLRATVDDAIATYRRRRVEREESEMLVAMLETLDKAVYFKDDQARHVHLADVSGGFDPAEARGQTDVDLYGDADPSAAAKALKDDMRVIENRESVVNREEDVGEDSELWMRTTKVPWVDEEGDVKGLIGHTTNVTEYKRREREHEELGRRFETFTSRLGHDVRTPLQVASGHLELARDTGDAESVRDARQALERIDQIVSDYGTLSSQATRIDDVSPVDLRRAVDEVWDGLDSRGTDLTVDLDGSTYINATEQMTRPVLENLLKNAIAHAGPDVTVRVGTTEDGFFVEDTGRGIPEAEREAMLAESSTERDGNGQGLGIIMGEMEKHVWSLSVHESPEGGSRFQVDNCLFEDEADQPVEEQTPIELDQKNAVGTLQEPGSAEYEATFDRWVLTSGGDDIFRQNNNFYYVHGTVDGPARIEGKVADVEYVDDYSKGGFMVRDSLETDSTYAYVGKTPGHGTELLWRSETGDSGRSRQLEEQAFTFNWYRLDRDGDEVRFYISIDGERWQQIDRKQVALSDPLHVGMVTCSRRKGTRSESLFEGVTASQWTEKS